MPTTIKIPKLVYVMVAGYTEVPEAEFFNAARMGCRLALNEGLQAVNPYLQYKWLYNDEELTAQLRALSQWWLKRCQRIWLCSRGDSELALDSVSYWILLNNEGLHTGRRKRHYLDRQRRPVYYVDLVADHVQPRVLKREELEDVLQLNISCLLGGLASG